MHSTSRSALALFVGALLFVGVAAARDASPLLHALFQDHVVLQRDAPIPVWGHAASGSTVTVTLAGNSAKATADASGRWAVELPALPAGGPHSLEASDGSSKQSVSDVLVGDVFLCSGQSNMEWPVNLTPNAQSEVAASTNDRIRMLKVGLDATPEPRETFSAPVQWQLASPETVGGWSAVCYYYAREIQKTVDVPIGLVNASWGGTDIRAWMSAEALASVGGYESDLALLEQYRSNPTAAQAAFGKIWEDWWRKVSGDAPGSEPWQPAVGREWPAAPAQLADWKQWGVDDLRGHNGMLWHRTTFTLTEDQAKQDGVLLLGGVDEVDQTFLNGHAVGNTFGWGTPRRYDVPANILKSGENVLVVNILNTWGQGGLTGDAPRSFLPAGDSTVAIPLDGWQYAKVPIELGFGPRTPWESVGGRTTIHNAMTAPLGSFRFRGALWYQGESNTGEGYAYEGLMRALMAQWRDQFGDPELPVLIVQLANYGRIPTAPTESGSAEVREAQRRAAAADPHAAIAVTIDIGDPDDIHPRNKQEVGRRLARAARNVIYGEDIAPSGPVPASAKRSGSSVIVSFSDVQGHLEDHDEGALTGFELCGAERGSCHFATATIDGNNVRLRGSSAVDAVRVRYCWGDSPFCTLRDGSGLPAGPFEIPIAGD
ncbi:MAG TPA: sialate O-acetylesterase [Rhodothermales bacterium]